MGEFVNFITKGITIEKQGDRRIFSGHITAEIVDHQNDFIFVKEVMDVMVTYMKNLPVVSEVHSNRMVGKTLAYEKSEIEGVASVLVTMEIFKDDRVTLYDDVWNKIKDGTYSGLSMGGGSKDREPMMKDGRIVMNLKNLELYEIAVCPSPANPLALIEKYNSFAKSGLMEKAIEYDGRNILQCSSIGCVFNKEVEGMNTEIDIDIDNKRPGEFKPEVRPELKKEGATNGVSSNDAGSTNPIHSDPSQKNISKHGAEEIAEDTRRKDTKLDTNLEDEVLENLKTNNMNKIAPILARVAGEMVASTVADSVSDVEKNSEVPSKKVDESGEDIKQFDKEPEEKNPEIKKHDVLGLTEEYEYGEKRKKRMEKTNIIIISAYLKQLDDKFCKNNLQIEKLKNQLL